MLRRLLTISEFAGLVCKRGGCGRDCRCLVIRQGLRVPCVLLGNKAGWRSWRRFWERGKWQRSLTQN